MCCILTRHLKNLYAQLGYFFKNFDVNYLDAIKFRNHMDGDNYIMHSKSESFHFKITLAIRQGSIYGGVANFLEKPNLHVKYLNIFSLNWNILVL